MQAYAEIRCVRDFMIFHDPKLKDFIESLEMFYEKWD